jgi:hypothetical protein
MNLPNFVVTKRKKAAITLNIFLSYSQAFSITINEAHIYYKFSKGGNKNLGNFLKLTD